jgi:peptide-methionine (R)-S-oxide reductase
MNALPTFAGTAGVVLFLAAMTGCTQPTPRAAATVGGTNGEGRVVKERVEKTDAEWRKALTPEQYHVMREKGTERPFTGKYWDTKEPGVYRCAACGQALFASDTKFESGCGWPSFSAPAATNDVAYEGDRSHGLHRVEVTCSRCGAHLGHVFEDGPTPTGLRYCINSVSLDFEKKASENR